ncbi:hypothetical protein BDZ97DRAFT_208381 [Flammula alnicola]|nr:hypothetical protein BDZ97DRAFT_208381 [Flammula alnicola]
MWSTTQHHYWMLYVVHRPQISVLVFSSMNDTTEEGKTCENGRIGSIVRHLQPHIERCTSIDFHATFASSLPSPALFLALEVLDLEDLTLEYQVHDLAHVADNRKRARITHNLTSHAVVAFPKLTKLSLSGHAFMDILRLGDGRLSRVKNDFYLTLHISDFQFMNTKRHTDDSGTFFVFMQLISALSPLGGIHLKNLSLSYRPHKRRDTEYLYHVDAASISFDNVSPGFIMEFFQLATLNVNCTTFSHCSFPPVSGSFSSYCLTIEDMPSSDISAHNDDSLYNIISIWNNGDCLEVASCPAFNDEFLHWLGEEREDGKVEAEQNQIKLLQVRDCTNFTAGALRRLIDILNDSARLDLLEREPVTRLLEVMVSGRGPALDVEDLEWFRKNSGATGVRWKVDGADGSKVFLEHLPD